jgi:hypothetical protein
VFAVIASHEEAKQSRKQRRKRATKTAATLDSRTVVHPRYDAVEFSSESNSRHRLRRRTEREAKSGVKNQILFERSEFI